MKDETGSTQNNKPFPIVAIGASAGGLEAISKFLQTVSPDLGIAYVIIQHLSPTHQSILPELLERKTSMKVRQVVDGMHVEPDSVYVIPPNAYMSIIDSKLTLAPRVKTEGTYHSIDHFLTALASVYKNNAIAIILSGTATDGTDGIRAIKAEGGITFAQDESAKFRGMPDNAADSGYVDFVLPPEKIAAEVESLVKLPYTGLTSLEELSLQDQELRKVHILLFKARNVDFSSYKQTTINRRIARRMALNKITKLEDYSALLLKRPDEVDLLYKDLLINVTSFFREPNLFAEFSKSIFPALLHNQKPSEILRIWVAACSSGEEAYSIAICLFEYLNEQSIVRPVQIFATDLSQGAIEKARSGVYSKSAVENISAARLERFFVKLDGQYQIIKPIRDICIFATQNLLRDPPFSKLDFISCQNVLIYLEAESQKRILQSFHYSLKQTGYLLLGKSETIGKASELFSPASKDFKLFMKKDGANYHYDFSVRNPLQLNAAAPEGKMGEKQIPDPDIDKEAEKILLSRFVPPSVIINKDFQVAQFYGSTLNYLHPAAGKASLHLLKMVREELIVDVRTLVHRAKKEKLAVKKEGIVLLDNNAKRDIAIEVIPIRRLGHHPHYLVLFRDMLNTANFVSTVPGSETVVGKKDSKDRRLKLLEQEVQSGREQMKLISEEAEANREELQSANEEILSSNEELQSINEELETSKEELQSSNEELNTINEELLCRNNELKDAVEYSDAIVQTMIEPLVVLNSDLRIRTANKAFYQSFRVHPADTEGNYFYETGSGQWNVPEIRSRLDNIIHTDKSFDHFEVTLDFPAIGLKTLQLNAMRMGPENSRNRRYLLAIQDITQQMNNLKELNYSKEYFQLLVQNAFDIITIFSREGDIKYQSESLHRILGYETSERVGKNIFSEPIVHPEDLPKKREFFNRCAAAPNQPVTEEFRLLHKDGGYRHMEAVCVNLLDNPYINGLVANYRDITRQKALERQKEEFIAIASHELRTPVTSIKGYAQIIQSQLAESDERDTAGMISKLNIQVDRLTNLLQNLLDVTKITGGQLDLQYSSFDINVLIREIAEENRLTTQKQILCELQACPLMTGDRERLRQVITNLLSNAIKYSPQADRVIVKSSFSISRELSGPAVTVSVQDFGFGISKEDQAEIFERFFRTKNSKTNLIPGLGLGLYISAQIIKRHNGLMRVQSEQDKGSTFGFTIPVMEK